MSYVDVHVCCIGIAFIDLRHLLDLLTPLSYSVAFVTDLITFAVLLL